MDSTDLETDLNNVILFYLFSGTVWTARYECPLKRIRGERRTSVWGDDIGHFHS